MHPCGAGSGFVAPTAELCLLGPLTLRVSPGREAITVLAQPKRLALLAYLAAAVPPGFHRRDSLLALFWPEVNQEHGRTALRKSLHFLRHELGASVIVSRGDEIGVLEGSVWCDVWEFDRAVAAGEMAHAVDLYRGDLLPGLFISDAPHFERWLEDERAQLRAQAAQAGWAFVERLEREQDADGAAHWARWAYRRAPDDERALRRLISLLVRLGDRSGAVGAYEQFARRLEREYNVTPSPETQALVNGMRAECAAGPARTSAPTARGEVHSSGFGPSFLGPSGSPIVRSRIACDTRTGGGEPMR
jgi:DNA-binding SARP family transcriptional activator